MPLSKFHNVLLVLRIRKLVFVALFITTLSILTAFIPSESYKVIGRLGVYNVLWSLPFSLYCIPVVVLNTEQSETINKLSPYVNRNNAIDSLLLASCILLGSVLATAGDLEYILVLRTAIYYSLLAAVLVPFSRNLAYFVPIANAIVIWILGVDNNSKPLMWAFALQPYNATTPWIANACLLFLLVIVKILRKPS